MRKRQANRLLRTMKCATAVKKREYCSVLIVTFSLLPFHNVFVFSTFLTNVFLIIACSSLLFGLLSIIAYFSILLLTTFVKSHIYCRLCLSKIYCFVCFPYSFVRFFFFVAFILVYFYISITELHSVANSLQSHLLYE